MRGQLITRLSAAHAIEVAAAIELRPSLPKAEQRRIADFKAEMAGG